MSDNEPTWYERRLFDAGRENDRLRTAFEAENASLREALASIGEDVRCPAEYELDDRYEWWVKRANALRWIALRALNGLEP
ncbi:MAG: hypothetical protein GWP74_19985 [Proteobacteria bacterium]|nr:hypothetical protein [Pseudomonadota bacterium]